uniref:Uncharacterized protein n=1 Tax=Chromera velia CCMP2878 TaxID=1169474 RepID=A0A0G4GHT2_9ALVE|eukprot:Cvel_4725.t1-p1 / transcript=Cvel_4725.t1 / gene=Cvel_4725 / organism=Chromera_velia_CCMP2878 / gene_product=hypothetical protein / transcript_product=hypothetical protein / location=Cvel_scaffold210:18745-34134(-) / protein_length=1169 / sequence_SO=supercontig / SO=protein_coding / is_pseudo=false
MEEGQPYQRGLFRKPSIANLQLLARPDQDEEKPEPKRRASVAYQKGESKNLTEEDASSSAKESTSDAEGGRPTLNKSHSEGRSSASSRDGDDGNISESDYGLLREVVLDSFKRALKASTSKQSVGSLAGRTVMSRALTEMLSYIAMYGTDPETLQKGIQWLALRHVHYSASPHLFNYFQQAMMYSLEQLLGDLWSDQFERAWQWAFTNVATLLLQWIVLMKERMELINSDWKNIEDSLGLDAFSAKVAANLMAVRAALAQDIVALIGFLVNSINDTVKLSIFPVIIDSLSEITGRSWDDKREDAWKWLLTMAAEDKALMWTPEDGRVLLQSWSVVERKVLADMGLEADGTNRQPSVDGSADSIDSVEQFLQQRQREVKSTETTSTVKIGVQFQPDQVEMVEIPDDEVEPEKEGPSASLSFGGDQKLQLPGVRSQKKKTTGLFGKNLRRSDTGRTSQQNMGGGGGGGGGGGANLDGIEDPAQRLAERLEKGPKVNTAVANYLAKKFFPTLLGEAPTQRQIWVKNIDTGYSEMFKNVLNRLFAYWEEPDKIWVEDAELGLEHVSFSVTCNSLLPFGKVLQDLFANICKEEWTAEFRTVWSKVWALTALGRRKWLFYVEELWGNPRMELPDKTKDSEWQAGLIGKNTNAKSKEEDNFVPLYSSLSEGLLPQIAINGNHDASSHPLVQFIAGKKWELLASRPFWFHQMLTLATVLSFSLGYLWLTDVGLTPVAFGCRIASWSLGLCLLGVGAYRCCVQYRRGLTTKVFAGVRVSFELPFHLYSVTDVMRLVAVIVLMAEAGQELANGEKLGGEISAKRGDGVSRAYSVEFIQASITGFILWATVADMFVASHSTMVFIYTFGAMFHFTLQYLVLLALLLIGFGQGMTELVRESHTEFATLYNSVVTLLAFAGGAYEPDWPYVPTHVQILLYFFVFLVLIIFMTSLSAALTALTTIISGQARDAAMLSKIQKIVDIEYSTSYDKLDRIHKSLPFDEKCTFDQVRSIAPDRGMTAYFPMRWHASRMRGGRVDVYDSEEGDDDAWPAEVSSRMGRGAAGEGGHQGSSVETQLIVAMTHVEKMTAQVLSQGSRCVHAMRSLRRMLKNEGIGGSSSASETMTMSSHVFSLESAMDPNAKVVGGPGTKPSAINKDLNGKGGTKGGLTGKGNKSPTPGKK